MNSQVDGLSISGDWEILKSRYPYLPTEINRHQKSPDSIAQKLLMGMRGGVDGRLKIVFDCNNLEKIHNGTSEVAKHVLMEFGSEYYKIYKIYVHCSMEAYVFHGFENLQGIMHLENLSDPAKDEPYFASIRLVQPFHYADIASLTSQAPITMFLILDTIAVDCMQIAPHLACVWERMIRSASALGFISDFSRAQFERRFSCEGDHVSFTALCSTDTREYRNDEYAGPARDDGYVLLVGNPYEHKFLKASSDKFRQHAPNMRLVVLGLKVEDSDQVVSFSGGQLDDNKIAELYAHASVVMFPSHYEGFGLPIMHGLARQKPIIARDLPVFWEIRDRLREAANLHLFATTEEMVRFAATKPIWDPREVDPPQPVQSWRAMARAISEALVEAREKLTYNRLRSRLLEAEACRQIALLDEVKAGYDLEFAEIRARYDLELAEIRAKLEVAQNARPVIDEADLPARSARFIVDRLEGRLYRLLAHRWLYALMRSGWILVKKVRQ